MRTLPSGPCSEYQDLTSRLSQSAPNPAQIPHSKFVPRTVIHDDSERDDFAQSDLFEDELWTYDLSQDRARVPLCIASSAATTNVNGYGAVPPPRLSDTQFRSQSNGGGGEITMPPMMRKPGPVAIAPVCTKAMNNLNKACKWPSCAANNMHSNVQHYEDDLWSCDGDFPLEPGQVAALMTDGSASLQAARLRLLPGPIANGRAQQLNMSYKFQEFQKREASAFWQRSLMTSEPPGLCEDVLSPYQLQALADEEDKDFANTCQPCTTGTSCLNPGSFGHPELCMPPCYYFATGGTCNKGAQCAHCHCPHEHRERHLHFDKRTRDQLRSMSYASLLAVVAPLLHEKADELGLSEEFSTELIPLLWMPLDRKSSLDVRPGNALLSKLGRMNLCRLVTMLINRQDGPANVVNGKAKAAFARLRFTLKNPTWSAY